MFLQFWPMTTITQSSSLPPIWWVASEPTRCLCANDLEYSTEDTTTHVSGLFIINSSSPLRTSVSLKLLRLPSEFIKWRNTISWYIFRPLSQFLSDAGTAPPLRSTYPRVTKRSLSHPDAKPNSINTRLLQTPASRSPQTSSTLHGSGIRLKFLALWIPSIFHQILSNWWKLGSLVQPSPIYNSWP